jgi:hypothetical protein
VYVFKAPSLVSACCNNTLYHLQLMSVSVLVEQGFVPSILTDLLVVSGQSLNVVRTAQI